MRGLSDVSRMLGVVIRVVTVIVILQVCQVGQQCLGRDIERLQQVTLLIKIIYRVLICS